MRRMRTAPGVLAIIRDEDPDTAVTLRYIRRLISTGEVPVTHVGKKLLVDADKVIEHIANGGSKPRLAPSPSAATGTGGIRRVPV